MPVLPALPPHSVPILSGFDYVAADAKRHRIYASHTASGALTVVDSATGKVLGQIEVGGPPQGVAVDPATGIVYTGNGLARTITKVDPVAMKVLGSVDVAGNVDAIAYDPTLDRIYADEDDGTRGYHTFLFDIDGKKVIDAAVGGNAARWINHSCAPNCQAWVVEHAGGDPRRDRVVIETLRPIRKGEELPLDRLEAYVREHLPSEPGPLIAGQFSHGHSNLTYLLRQGSTEWILRRPPFGNQVKSAHDMGREYRVLSGLNVLYAAAPKPTHDRRGEGAQNAL